MIMPNKKTLSHSISNIYFFFTCITPRSNKTSLVRVLKKETNFLRLELDL